ncbi:D-glycero-beta-D-manno-heptose 1-phosphate adenylyltransferase [Mucilaginibacter koreensis]
MPKEIETRILNKIFTLPQLKEQVTKWKGEGCRIVFTNGCFDLLHTGHITYLAKAAELGDKLVIGLNADQSVQRLKGPNRPVNNEQSRSLLLAAMLFTDAIVVFDEDTPYEVITTLLPDILVKGGDYTIDKIVGAPEVQANGGEVKTINFVEGYSSTSIINRIRG